MRTIVNFQLPLAVKILGEEFVAFPLEKFAELISLHFWLKIDVK